MYNRRLSAPVAISIKYSVSTQYLKYLLQGEPEQEQPKPNSVVS